MQGPLARYRSLVADGVLDADPAQEAAVERLQLLANDLQKPPGFSLFARNEPVKGVYLWGGVGRGKSLLADIFFNNVAVERKRRAHFHEFMLDVHERINAWRALSDKSKRAHRGVNRKSPDDPMPPVAHDLAADARLLCFDEFQVTDIADAMILGRLFAAMFANGVTMVATSNRHPESLYLNGINRQLFMPTIDLIQTRFDVIELAAARDYRLARLAGAPVYHTPLGLDADAAMDAAWRRMIAGGREHAESLKVKGRVVHIGRAARGAARFTFDELCRRPLGAADYLAICNRYGAVYIDGIPQMGAEERNEAKRFVTLVDALYETRTKLVCSAAAPPERLYLAGDGSFEFERAASRLIEMQSTDYLGAEHEAVTSAGP